MATLSDAGSAASIPGFRSQTKDVDGVRLHYWLGGDPDGPPVLLWHGFLGTSYSWRQVAIGLAAGGLAVLVPDMRGYGDSDKPSGVQGYDARSLAAEFRFLVGALGFGGGRPIILAAHDMGAPPALLWAADHPDEVAGLLYLEAPVMLAAVLTKTISYTPEAATNGSMWWWLLPLAPGVPDSLVVGNERAFLTWFYNGATAKDNEIKPAAVEEYLRTFQGREGVLGATGVYRAAFTSIDQTEPLTTRKVQVPVTAIGGDQGLGAQVGQTVAMVAANVDAEVLPGCGHFVAEECPNDIARRILAMAGKTDM